MKKFFSSLFILCFCVSLFAIDFHIFVIDSEIDIPLEGVVLSLADKSAGPWETDFNGECIISVEDSPSIILQAYLPGYSVKKIRLSSNQTDVTIDLSIEEVMEGKELVVEKEAYQTADSEAGISVALTKDQIQNTSMIGALPDVMTTIKTLPGVGYAGAFCQQPSIRGSYPYETACVLDGMYVLQPYHWSGTVSIFDPLMVDTVKLSHGIFSAQYGHATAALLDVNSVNPVGDSVKINASISSIQSDLFAQIPITQKFGIMSGFRMTYLNTIPFLYDNLGITWFISRGEINKISDYLRMPYLYDYYLKAFYTPADNLSINLNAFLGMEGLGAKLKTETPEEEINNPTKNYKNFYKDYYSIYSTDVHADWKNIFGFGALNIKWLPVDVLQLVASASYNIYNNIIDAKLDNMSNTEYSYDDFDWKNGEDKLFFRESYNHEYFQYTDSYYIQLYQGKVAANYQINNTNLVSLGAEELFQSKTSNHIFAIETSYYDLEWTIDEEKPEVTDVQGFKYKYNTDVKGNYIYNTAGYSFWEFGNDTSLVKGELGLRFEHYFLDRKDEQKSISTNPYFNPRFSIQFTPIRNKNGIDKLTVSAGSGIFTKIIDETMNLSADYNLNKDNFKPDENIFGLIGAQIDFLENLSFQIETYYKYYLHRFYTVKTPTDENDQYGNAINNYAAFSDGIGHVAGFDCMLHKKSGRYLDGYLCYSYVFARYKNPSGYEKDVVTYSEQNDPIGIWYYPYYHRYHTFTSVLNYRPTCHATFTASAGFASGVPKEVYSEKTDEKEYSDFKRQPPVFPVNLRFAYSNYADKSKIKWEAYVGIENLLGMLNKTSLLGAIIEDNEIDLSNIANFDTGIPSISLGFRLSY